jgi:hypothetical protein
VKLRRLDTSLSGSLCATAIDRARERARLHAVRRATEAGKTLVLAAVHGMCCGIRGIEGSA